MSSRSQERLVFIYRSWHKPLKNTEKCTEQTTREPRPTGGKTEDRGVIGTAQDSNLLQIKLKRRSLFINISNLMISHSPLQCTLERGYY